jgi:NADPH:quinone reductase-like Zn-dependent oxidoreductase
MKAIAQDVYGEAEVLSLRDVEIPSPGPREVLVRVRAAGVDMGVWHYMAGMPLIGRLGFGLRAPRVRVRGMDLAGVVDQVGPEVTEFQPGDEVFGVGRTGTFAEYAVARVNKLEPMPTNISFEQAAASPISGVTALQGWTALGDRPTPHSVLVIGAGGGVGSFAVQVAKAGDARVTGVCSGGKAEFVRGLGADAVIDYTRDDLTGRYDSILDIAGNRPLPALRALLNPGGTLVILGGEGGGAWFGGLHRTMRAALPASGQKLKALVSLVKRPHLVKLRELIESGAVTPAVDRTFALADAPDAVRYLRDGRVRGKVVIVT